MLEVWATFSLTFVFLCKNNLTSFWIPSQRLCSPRCMSSLANFHTLAFSLILLRSLYVCARVCEHMSPTPLIKCQCSPPALIRVAVKAPSNCMWPAAPLPRTAQGYSISLEHLFEYLTVLWMASTIHQDILEQCFLAYFVLCTSIDFGQIPLKVCYF